MPHPAAKLVPILTIAKALGIEVQGRHARCFNTKQHHNNTDKRPSLSFSAESECYRCFSCGVSGDAIELVRAFKNCNFREAVSWIESLAGQESSLPHQNNLGGTKRHRWPDKLSQDIYAVLYESCCEVDATMKAGRYLKKRGIGLDLANDHQVTELVDPKSVWDQLKSGFSLEELKQAGLVSRTDRFLFNRHQLLFFYFDGGWPVYIQGRDLSGNSPAKELSLAGLTSPVPYNVNLIRKNQDQVYLCEGCIDTLSALQMQLPAVGVPGVTSFHSDWFDYFQTVKHVLLLFDNDEAGHRHAAELRMQFRKRGIKADAIYPPSVKDVNDLLIQSLRKDT